MVGSDYWSPLVSFNDDESDDNFDTRYNEAQNWIVKNKMDIYDVECHQSKHLQISSCSFNYSVNV